MPKKINNCGWILYLLLFFIADSISYPLIAFSQEGYPTVTTSPISVFTANEAVSGGNVTAEGSSPVTEKGVCWSTEEVPSAWDPKDGKSESYYAGAGSFTSSISGLSPNTVYYVRAYATNSLGTDYGTQVSFTTSSDNNNFLTWVTSKNEAISAALSQGKYILLLAQRNNCGSCFHTRLIECERTDPQIKAMISENYVPWVVDIDTSTEWQDYAGGLGGFYLPLIVRINPTTPDVYIDRTTETQDAQTFYTRLQSGVDDKDSDSMPDVWEHQYNLNPLVDDANDDLDGDGWSNIQEYRRGTIPNDPESQPSKAMPWLPLILDDN